MLVILGAGITGLSIANFVKDDDYLILEKENEPGGYCRTIYKDGFTWDYSGHFFHFRNDDIKEYLLAGISCEVLEVQKQSQIFYNGSYIDFPFQKNIHQLPKDEFIDCLYDLFFRTKNNHSNFKEMLIGNFGKSICEKFLFPYNEKLYAANLENLDSDSMGRFFPRADIEQIISNFKQSDNASYNSSFIYPRDGAAAFVRSLEKKINKQKLLLNTEVLSIDINKKIVYTNNGQYKFDKLVSTLPFNRLLGKCDIPFNKDIYTANKVLVYNLGFDKKGNTKNHWIYYPSKDLVFYRVGFYNNIFNEDRLSLYVEIGCATDDSFDVNASLEKVLDDLYKVGIITDHKLVAWSSVTLDPAYVHINKYSQADLIEKNKMLNELDIYSIGRYGGWKYCSIEDNIIEARLLIDKLDL